MNEFFVEDLRFVAVVTKMATVVPPPLALLMLSTKFNFLMISECQGKFDLLVLLDTSSNLANYNLSFIKDFLIRVIDTFHIGPDGVQVMSYWFMTDKT